MAAIALASFLVAIAMPAFGLLGAEFFPVSDNSEFSVSIETPPGSNLDVHDAGRSRRSSAIARSIPGVARTYSRVGGATGAVDEGQIYVGSRAESRPGRGPGRRSRTRSAQRLGELGGVTASIQTSGFDNQKQIQVQISGPDVPTLSGLADRGPGSSSVRCPAPSTSACPRAARSPSSR